MTLAPTFDLPFLTTCDLCDAKTAAMPGPRNRRGRPEPPAGFRRGYIVEIAGRDFPICFDCVLTITSSKQT